MLTTKKILAVAVLLSFSGIFFVNWAFPIQMPCSYVPEHFELYIWQFWFTLFFPIVVGGVAFALIIAQQSAGDNKQC